MQQAAFAGTWQQDVFSAGSWSYADTNEVGKTGWKWLDGNKDGRFECYYLDENGVMAAGKKLGGDTVNADGQWVLSGSIQQRTLPAWISAAPKERRNQSVLAEGVKLQEALWYPLVSMSGKDVQKAVNRKITELVDSASVNTASEGDILAGASENTLDYDFLLSKQESYVGLSFQNYWYAKGAAHGMTMEYYLTITPEKGILSMEDIGGKSLEQAVTEEVRKELRRRTEAGELGLFVGADSVTVDYSRNNWMLADDGIHVIFQQYEIAPYAAGLIDVTVPYAAVRGQMNAYGRMLTENAGA